MIVTVFMATWLLQSVQAEGHMYSIEELNRMGQPEWKETYQANGRTVEVDCTVDIPDVSSFPVLTVQVMPPVEEPLYSALLQRYAAPKGTKLDYEFRSNDYQTVLSYADPGGWDEKAGEIPGKVTERWHSLLKYDLNGAYQTAKVFAFRGRLLHDQTVMIQILEQESLFRHHILLRR